MKPKIPRVALVLPLLMSLACDRSPGAAGASGAPLSTSPAAGAAAPGPAGAGTTPAGTPSGAASGGAPDLAKGRNLYAVYCLRCHGPKGEGNGPMAAMLGNVGNLADPAIAQRLPGEKMKELIKAGKNKMPAFGPVFSEEQLNQVVAFVQTLKR